MAKLKSIPHTPAPQPAFIDGEPLVAYRSIDDAAFAISAVVQRLTTSDPSSADDAELDGSAKMKRHNWDRLEHLQNAVSHMKAKSAGEAVMQICMVYAALDDLAHPELITGTDKEDPEWVRERVRRKVDRLLYSVLGWLHQAHGVDVDGVEEYFMNPDLSPWGVTGD